MKLRKTFLLFMLSFIMFGIFSPVQASENIKIRVNNKFVSTDVAPFIQNGRTMVPIRVISESLGYDVDWDQATQSIFITSEDKDGFALSVIMLAIGEYQCVWFDPNSVNKASLLYQTGYINEDEMFYAGIENAELVDLDSPPVIVNNRTFVPLRAIAELFGYNVSWDPVNRIVDIK